MARLEGHGGVVTALAVLPDGRVVSGSDDETIRLWDEATGAETARLDLDWAVTCLAIIASESLVVAGDRSGRIHWLKVR
jgi:WD40 repeat protein